MTLQPGARLGPYEVLATLGAGGMGEVYRAHDTKLRRDVAIKILPAAFTSDPDRLARFEREARLLASLNHPHIGAIYGFEQSDDVRALVLELVDGDTLADRMARGPVPLKDARGYARQIADALDAAHEGGIVHRDLKPANIKITPDGVVKVLDFGLATAVESPASAQSTVATQLVSQLGTIVGTAAYMSPEQARGLTVDKRTDIWAFGCVLFEMLSGKPAFAGTTVSDVMANVLHEEPAWDALPAATPTAVKRLITRCLEKDQKRRVRDIGDLFVELDEGSAPQSERSSRAWILSLAAGALAGAAITGAAIRYWTQAPPAAAPPPMARFTITPPEPITRISEGVLGISPDGHRIAYVAGHDGFPVLYVQDVDQFEGRMIPGTQGADFPAFSPDGAWLAFVADRKIKKVALAGGAPIVLCEFADGVGMTWGTDDNILFSGSSTGIWRVSSQGGAPTAVTTLRDMDLRHNFPDLLPDGKSLLYSTSAQGGDEAVYVQSLQTGERRLVAKGGGARYLSSGHILYVQNGVLFALPFDAIRQAVTGPQVLVLQGIRQRPRGAVEFAASRNGSLVYMPPEVNQDDSLVWVDRAGGEQPFGPERRMYRQPRLSPDGHRVVVSVAPPSAVGSAPADLWLYDVDRKTLSRFTTDGGAMPEWAPEGDRIAYTGNRTHPNDIYVRQLNGGAPAKRLIADRGPSLPLSWSTDGRFIAFVGVSPSTANDIWITDAIGKTAPRPLLQTKFREGAPTFSPDGRYVAYVSDSSGRNEIYLKPFDGPGEDIQVSANGGNEPVWSRRSQELFYRQDDVLMAVDIATGTALRVGKARPLFERAFVRTSALWPNYDVASDGMHFVMVKAASPDASHLNVVLNWRPAP